MSNFIQNFQNKSLISVSTCIKRYLQTLFEFILEKVEILEKSGIFLFIYFFFFFFNFQLAKSTLSLFRHSDQFDFVFSLS